MTIQRVFMAVILGFMFFWRGPDLITVKGLEVSAMNEHMLSGFFCAVSAVAIFMYASFHKKIAMFNAFIVYWMVLSLLAYLFIKLTHSLYWHSLLVNLFAILLTILLFEAYFFIRKLEEK